MGSSPFDSKFPIAYHNLEFLFGIIIQQSDNFLLNFLASKFNIILDQQGRKLQVHDWICSIKWLIDIYEFYDDSDFHFSFCKRLFYDELYSGNFFTLYRVLHFLENIENKNNFEDLQFNGEKKFDDANFHTLFIKGDPITEIDFLSYDLEEQDKIMDVYKTYKLFKNREYSENFRDEDQLAIVCDSIDTMLREEIFQDLNTQENIELLRGVCHKFMILKKNNPDQQLSDDNIEQTLNESITINSNLNLTAYYLHYIISSFGAIPKKKTKFGIYVFAGKQVDLLQRLLCSVTTHNWETADAKSNSYYKTVNGLFKFEMHNEKDNFERDKVINHLTKVRKMLTKGGFDEAVELLDNDVKTIKGEENVKDV